MSIRFSSNPGIRTFENAAGFTLVELAVAIFIIALVLGSIMVPLAIQMEQRQIGETQKAMEEIKEALIGFAIGNRYLPCPDTTGDGISDPATAGACPSAEGFLPWVTLNVGRADAWGNRFRYRISPNFSDTPAVSGVCTVGDGHIGLCQTGNLTISTRSDTTKTLQTLAANAVAVVISHGKNGYGATSSGGAPQASVPATNTDETINGDPPGTTFISRGIVASSATCSDTTIGQPFCEFDDLVVWLPRYTLISRMVAAGKLP